MLEENECSRQRFFGFGGGFFFFFGKQAGKLLMLLVAQVGGRQEVWYALILETSSLSYYMW